MSHIFQQGIGPGSALPPSVPFVFPIQNIAYTAGTMTGNAGAGDILQYNLTGSAATVGKPTNMLDGERFIIAIAQDATGSRTVSWNAVFNFPNGTPVLSTAADAVDYFACLYRAANSKYTGSAEKVDMLAQANGF